LPVIGYDSIEYASLTDVGIRRSHNQDAHGTLLATDAQQWQEQGHIFLVADGMGAHAVGELASELAVGIIPHTYHKHATQGSVPALRKAFVEANASIHAKGQQNPEFRGMGTTTTALLLRPEGAWVGHVGDSRVYRVRNGQIEQMSFDHSYVWEMARRQGVDPDTLPGIPSNVIVRSLGPEPLVQVDVEGPHPLQANDIFLLCSDGLSGQVSDAEIGAIAEALPPAEACHFLVDLANLRGGPDNITVLIVRVAERQGVTVTPDERRLPLLKRIPWSVWTILTGVSMAVSAAALNYFRLYGPGMVLFALAVIAIVTGLIGLTILFRREKLRLAAQPHYARPRVYRQANCKVEKSLVDRLALTVTGLEKQIKDRQWEVDWIAYQQFMGQAQNSIDPGHFADAFREYCRAMHLLADAVRQHRSKGENFVPVWDKGKLNGSP
jgi:protein phosphatase